MQGCGVTRLATLSLVAMLSLGACQSARSATCSEFTSQAEAQRAAESGEVRLRDGDGDGRYCEDLP